MNERAELVIARELSSDERLIWSGHPRRGFMLRGSDVYVIPFSVAWCGGVIFWAKGMYSQGEPLSAILFFGAVYLGLGTLLLISRFFVDARQRAATYYGLTNKRAIIISGSFHREVKSLNLRTLSDVSLSEHKGGSGTITLGPPNPLYMKPGSYGWFGARQYVTPSFEFINRAKDVYELLRRAQSGI